MSTSHTGVTFTEEFTDGGGLPSKVTYTCECGRVAVIDNSGRRGARQKAANAHRAHATKAARKVGA